MTKGQQIILYYVVRMKLGSAFNYLKSTYTDRKTLVKIPMLLCRNSYAEVWLPMTGPYAGILAEITIRIGKIPSLTWEFYKLIQRAKKIISSFFEKRGGSVDT